MFLGNISTSFVLYDEAECPIHCDWQYVNNSTLQLNITKVLNHKSKEDVQKHHENELTRRREDFGALSTDIQKLIDQEDMMQDTEADQLISCINIRTNHKRHIETLENTCTKTLTLHENTLTVTLTVDSPIKIPYIGTVTWYVLKRVDEEHKYEPVVKCHKIEVRVRPFQHVRTFTLPYTNAIALSEDATYCYTICRGYIGVLWLHSGTFTENKYKIPFPMGTDVTNMCVYKNEIYIHNGKDVVVMTTRDSNSVFRRLLITDLDSGSSKMCVNKYGLYILDTLSKDVHVFTPMGKKTQSFKVFVDSQSFLCVDDIIVTNFHIYILLYNEKDSALYLRKYTFHGEVVESMFIDDKSYHYGIGVDNIAHVDPEVYILTKDTVDNLKNIQIPERMYEWKTSIQHNTLLLKYETSIHDTGTTSTFQVYR